jgi:FMN phosphatase YigB (HAD superfamily)
LDIFEMGIYMPILRQKNTIEAILFDLDGTLLRVQMREFIPQYILGLSAYCADRVKPKKFEKALLASIRDLIHTEGDSSMTNEERVYREMLKNLALPESVMRESLAHFKDNGLAELEELIQPIPLAGKIVKDCQKKGIPMVLATNPVFPKFMIQARMQWAGLEENSFTHVTSFENSHYCKPQAGYFQEIADHIEVDPKNCLMVGNDTSHDLAASAIGMTTYLVDTWLVDRGGSEWPCENRGDHSSLQQFLQEHLD